ncbi:MAG: GNAT family N-acetyltransferase [Deltaproteobacteria bacterium]|nr:GNAT family N-acetyltransferase [Candidatus Zymogenaceae bacterium]
MTYPSQYEKEMTLKGGEIILFRPVRDGDVPLIKDFYNSLSERTKYLRFFTPKKEAREDRIRRFATVDYITSMVIVAEYKGELVGIARYDWEEEEQYLELAETIRDDWQGKGLGTQLFLYMIDVARDNNYTSMTALILDENKKPFAILKKTVGNLKLKYERNFIMATFDI